MPPKSETRSKTGRIRSALGPIRARLVDQIKEARVSQEPLRDASLSKTDNLHAFHSKRCKARELVKRLRRSIEMTNTKMSAWSDALEEIDSDDQDPEYATWEQWIQGDQGLDNLLLLAEDAIASREVLITELDLAEKLEESRDTQQTTSPTNPQDTQHATRAMSVPLPQVSIPKFSGDPLKWTAFWDVFEVSVHEAKLPMVYKMQYLSDSMVGAAKSAIAGMSITKDNYLEAVAIVKERFGDKKQIIRALYSRLHSLKVASSSVPDVRSALETIEGLTRQLAAVGEDMDQNQVMLTVYWKFHESTLEKVELRKEPSVDWTLETFKKAMWDSIKVSQAVRHSGRPQESNEGGSYKSRDKRNRRNGNAESVQRRPDSKSEHAPVSSVTSLAAGSAANAAKKGAPNARQEREAPAGRNDRTRPNANNTRVPASPKYECFFCGDHHYARNCTKYPTAEDRKRKAHELKMCLICLFKGHSTSTCQLAFRKCFLCREVGHHTALCSNPGRRQGATSTSVTAMVQMPLSLDTVSSEATAVLAGSIANKSVDAVLMFGVIPVRNPVTNVQKETRVVFDTGSMRSWVSDQFSKTIDLPKQYEEYLTVQPFGNTQPQKAQGSHRFEMDLVFRSGSTMRIGASSTKAIVGSQQVKRLHEKDMQFIANTIPMEQMISPIDGSVTAFKPDLLLGLDLFGDLLDHTSGSPWQQMPSGVYLIATKFGYIVGGAESLMPVEKASSYSVCLTAGVRHHAMDTEAVVEQQLSPENFMQKYMELDAIGITDDPVSKDDQKAVAHFKKTVKFVSPMYRLKWPFIEPRMELLNNYHLAVGRLKSQARRFDKDPLLFDKCSAVFQDQMKRGIIEHIPAGQTFTELKPSQKKAVHYLPWHPVITPKKTTTNCRVVFDGSARAHADANSFNECTLRGPVLLPDLVGLLLRFRTYPIGIVGDVEKAYLMLGLQDEDKDFCRCVMIRVDRPVDFNNLKEDDLIELRFDRVIFGAKPSAFMLGATIHHHFSSYIAEDKKQGRGAEDCSDVGMKIPKTEEDSTSRSGTPLTHEDSDQEHGRVAKEPIGELQSDAEQHHDDNGMSNSEIAERIRDDTYVDNLVSGTDTVQKGDVFIRNGKLMFMDANMNFREITTNNPELRKMIAEKDGVNSEIVKVLGLMWNTTKDELVVPGSDAFNEKCLTKRDVHRIAAKVFDPLGFYSPVTLRAKLFLKHLWESKLDWDDVLTAKQAEMWSEIGQGIVSISTLPICRYMGINCASEHCQLHAFVDASGESYAAAIYLRGPVQGGPEIITTLVFSKTRVAPQQKMTIPRLELIAITIGVNAIAFVKKHLQIRLEKIYLWSDSTCCLHWIMNGKKQEVFVENRLKKIRSHENIEFRHISGEQNPADCATRGLTATELKEHAMWWNGPVWINRDPNDWPHFPGPVITPDRLKNFELVEYVLYETSALSVGSPKTEPKIPAEDLICISSHLIDLRRFEKKNVLLRATSFVLRFLKRQLWSKLSASTTQNSPHLKRLLDKVTKAGHLTAEDIKSATYYWERREQQENFGQLLADCRQGRPNPLIQELGIELDSQGLLRSNWRLGNMDAPEDAKFPKLLPRNSHYTAMVVMDVHQRLFHADVTATLAEVRQEYWIPRGRQAVSSILQKNCMMCRQLKAKPFELPPMPDLPRERVVRSRPYQHVGLDYLGPLWVKDSGITKKVWIALFTCFTTRLVHLEVVYNLSALEFLSAFRRFVARNGCPDTVISDNGTQFTLAQKTLNNEWLNVQLDKDIQSYAASKGIKWKFITAYSPWKGGMYESMVKLVKEKFKAAVGRQLLDMSGMTTYIAEVEAIVNSRPLTTVPGDGGVPRTIRPIDFKSPDVHIGLIRSEEEDDGDPEYKPNQSSAEKLGKIWQATLKCLNRFWELWHVDYLPLLRQRYSKQHDNPRSVAKSSPRVKQIVLVEEPGIKRGEWKHGRVMIVNTSEDGNVRSANVLLPSGNVVSRPVSMLSPLEIEDEDEEAGEAKAKSEPSADDAVDTEPSTESAVDPDRTPTTQPQPSPANQHRYNTRSRKTITGSVTSIALLLLFFFISGVNGHECPESCETCVPSNVMESHKCRQEGITIYRRFADEYCYRKLRCNSSQHLDGMGNCGSMCECPPWAQECSHYTGKAPESSGDVNSILDSVKPNFCSLEPTPHCNKEPVNRRIAQVQLYDQSKHLVKDLHLVRTEATPDEFECVGTGDTVGTKEYCDHHQCGFKGTCFCFHRRNDITYLVTDEGRLPIVAWGHVHIPVYGPKDLTPLKETCDNCEINCVKGGVSIELDEDVGMIEVCAEPFCYRISHPGTETTVMLPPQVNLYDHQVKLTVWSNGLKVMQMEQMCNADPFCEEIKCYFCWMRLMNPHCAPMWVWLTLIAMAYGSSLTLLILVKVAHYSTMTCSTMCKCGKCTAVCCRRICRCRKKKRAGRLVLPLYASMAPEEDSEDIPLMEVVTRPQAEESADGTTVFARSTGHRQFGYTSSSTMFIVAAALVICLLPTANGCVQSVSLNAQQSSCVVTPQQSLECSITDTTRLSLAPTGQEVCLLLSDPTNEPIGTVAIQVESASYMCEPQSNYYTRDFEMKVQSSKRCSGSGSCAEEKCEAVGADSKLKELDGEPNSSPGFTHCVASSGCWAMGCFYCTSACLYYRVFASPVSDVLYESFNCPNWKFTLSLLINVHVQNEPVVSHRMLLKPGVQMSWNKIKLSLTNSQSPPMPILGTNFITDGKRTVLLASSPAGQPIAGLAGALQCSSREKAERFQCYVSKDECHCDAGEYKVSCLCEGSDFQSGFKSEKLLPIKTGQVTLTALGKKVSAEITSFVSLEAQVQFEGFRLALKSNKNKCKLKPISLSGCYNCLIGAQFKFSCATDFGGATGHVRCPSVSFSVRCESNGFAGTTVLSFDRSSVDEVCSIVCPAGSSSFPLRATLAYVEHHQLSNATNCIVDRPVAADFNVDFMIGWLQTNWQRTLIALAVTCGLVVLTFIVLQSCVPMLCGLWINYKAKLH